VKMKITWITFDHLTKKNSKLYSKQASIRYRVIIPAAELKAQNYQTKIITVDKNTNIQSIIPSLKKTDIIIFSKSFTSLNESLAMTAKAMGIKVIFDICDNHFEHPQSGPHYHTMVNLADQIVVNTKQMAEIVEIKTNKKSIVITDPYEGQRNVPCLNVKDNRLKLLWFGHAANIDSLPAMIPLLLPLSQQKNLELHIVTAADRGVEQVCVAFNQQHGQQFNLRFSEWSLHTLFQALQKTDIVVIPSLMNHTKIVKSPNRLVESLWAGRFVVAQPIPSYQEFSQWAYVDQDMVTGIQWAIQNPALVIQRIAQAQDYIAQNFSPALIGQQWIQAINSV